MAILIISAPSPNFCWSILKDILKVRPKLKFCEIEIENY